MSSPTGQTEFAITDTKRSVPAVTLQLKIMKNYLRSYNMILKETNFNQKWLNKQQTDI